MEGALAGVRSIALSQAYSREGMGDTVPFAAGSAWAARALEPLVTMDMAPGSLINVNFPALPPEEVKGVRVCRQGIRDYGRLRLVERRIRAATPTSGSVSGRSSKRRGTRQTWK